MRCILMRIRLVFLLNNLLVVKLAEDEDVLNGGLFDFELISGYVCRFLKNLY